MAQLCEFIDESGTSSIHVLENMYELQEKFDKLFLDLNLVLALDLHGVTDLFPEEAKISKYPICIISFVGEKSEMRKLARTTCINRIKNKQAFCAVFVFKRSKFPGPGTKPDIIEMIHKNMRTVYFIDDGADHIKAVNNLENAKILSHKVSGESADEIKQIIKKIETKK